MERLRDGVRPPRSRARCRPSAAAEGCVGRVSLHICVEPGCGGQGGGELDRLERGQVAAHGDRGAERDGRIHVAPKHLTKLVSLLGR